MQQPDQFTFADHETCPPCNNKLLDALADFATFRTMMDVQDKMMEAAKGGHPVAADVNSMLAFAVNTFMHMVIRLESTYPGYIREQVEAANRWMAEQTNQPLEVIERSHADVIHRIEEKINHGR